MLLAVAFSGCTDKDPSPGDDPEEHDAGDGTLSTSGGKSDPQNGEGEGGEKGDGDDRESDDDPGQEGNSTDDQGDGEGNETTGGDGDGNFTLPNKDGNKSNGSEEPSDPWAGDDPQWPPLSEASVRPGVRVAVATDHCTSNFVFRDREDGELFLGLAAHCVHGMPRGQEVSIYGIDGDFVMKAPVVYSSWRAIGFDPDQQGAVETDVHPHDFALLKIPRDNRVLVHPAVMHYEGPKGVALWEDPSFGDTLVAYGNSRMRPVDDLDPQFGFYWDSYSYSVQGSTGHSVVAHMLSPPLPGDSGSPLLTAQGEALGVLSSVTLGTPYGVWWEYSSLPHALESVRGHMDQDIVLATWEAFDADL